MRFGAPKQILYEAHPHIGTDLLRNIVRNIRKEIQSLGWRNLLPVTVGRCRNPKREIRGNHCKWKTNSLRTNDFSNRS